MKYIKKENKSFIKEEIKVSMIHSESCKNTFNIIQ